MSSIQHNESIRYEDPVELAILAGVVTISDLDTDGEPRQETFSAGDTYTSVAKGGCTVRGIEHARVAQVGTPEIKREEPPKDETTKAELDEKARKLEIEGRSKLNKSRLAEAVENAEDDKSEPTKKELDERARELKIKGRSKLTKAKLIKAIEKAEK